MPNAVTRATVPQNFIDEVDSDLRLPQPIPQFLFARMALAGNMNFQALMSGAANARAFAVENAGGAVLTPEFDELIRVADAFPNGVQVVNDFGVGKGGVLKFVRDLYDGGGYSELERRVQGTKPTSQVGQGVKQDEVSLVLHQYEGPWDKNVGRVEPFDVHEFDAKYLNPKENLRSLVGRNLTYDFLKWLDTVIRNLYRNTNNITFADGKTSVTQFTAGGGSQPDMQSMFAAISGVSNREIRPFPSGRYLTIVPTDFDAFIVDDPAYRQLSAFQREDRNGIYGYIATLRNTDIIQSSGLMTYTAGMTVPGGDGNGGPATVPAGVTLKEAIVCAPNAIGFGTAEMPRAFVADTTDYGKAAKFIWRGTHAFGTLEDRAVQRFIYQSS